MITSNSQKNSHSTITKILKKNNISIKEKCNADIFKKLIQLKKRLTEIKLISSTKIET